MASEQEMAELERMSNDWRPDAPGPLVGRQQSTSALVAEYAQADPVYVNKTKALSQVYSHYRPLKGDGNCGWRALAFGYFETLLRLGNDSKIVEEARRFRNFEGLMHAVGSSDVYEDFIEPTASLLEEQATTLRKHDGGDTLLAVFNDEAQSSQLTYSFKLITSAWIKSNAESYASFLQLQDVDVHTYCTRNIEPFSVELDHVGLSALATAIINEAGIAIEVLYLDRSAGMEVTPHRLPVLDADGQERKGGPTIRLLYRPGHYDLLYKTEDVVEMSRHAMSNPEIRLVSAPQIALSRNAHFPHDAHMDILADIPGFSTSLFPLAFTPTSTEPYQTKVSSTSRTMTPAKSIYAPYHSKSEVFTTSPRTTTPASPIYPSVDAAVKGDHSPKAAMNSPTSPNSKEPPIQADFRPYSRHQRKYDRRLLKAQGEQIQSDVLRECSLDRSKKEDPAHFTNQAFQPQIWHPGRDYEKIGESENSGRGSS